MPPLSVCLASFPGFHEAGFVGDHDGLGAVAQVELLEEVGDVRLDGVLADDERCGDLAVGEAAGDEPGRIYHLSEDDSGIEATFAPK